MELVNFIEDSQDYTWDETLSFPIPTLNYITKRTGQNMLYRFNTEEEAKGNVVALVRSAKNYLFRNRIDEKEQVYYMAHDKERLYKALEYILEFINFAFVTGDYVDFFKMTTGNINSLALRNAALNLLGGRMILPPNIEYGVGY